MKFCSKCGAELLDEAVVCPKCGCQVGEIKAAKAKPSALAIVGLVLGVVYFVPALVNNIVPLWIWTIISVIISVTGLVLSCVSFKKGKTAVGIAGVVFGALNCSMMIWPIVAMIITFIH